MREGAFAHEGVHTRHLAVMTVDEDVDCSLAAAAVVDVGGGEIDVVALGDAAIGGTGSEKEAGGTAGAIVGHELHAEAGDVLAHAVEVVALVDAHGYGGEDFAHAVGGEALATILDVGTVGHEVIAEEICPWLVLQLGAEGEEEMTHEDVEGGFYLGDLLLGGETSENGGLGGSWGLGVPLEEMDGGRDELVEGCGVVIAIAATVGVEGRAEGGEVACGVFIL